MQMRQEPSLLGAMQRLVEVGQDVVVHRAALLKAESAEEIRATLALAGGLVAGSILVLLGWGLAMAGLLVWLSEWIKTAPLLFAAGALHLLLAGALIWTARRKRARAERPLSAAAQIEAHS
jgi:uncharacterized membrane protein YqjE